MNLRVITNITKEYPDMFKIVVYKEPKVFVKSDSVKRNREVVSEDYVPQVSSLQRTKSLIRDIVLCNDFELFCTFTFDPKKVDSFNLPATWGVMSRWLHHQRNLARERGKDFKYLIIPERHKSGRWHFHALISGYSSTLKASNCVTPSLHRVYNLTSFRSGFTTAVFIDSKEGVSNYVTKYITKDFVTTFNQRRFFCSRNLVRPKRSTNSIVLSTTLPLFRRKVSENLETQTFIIDKSNYVCNNDVSTLDVVQYRF
ncbi:hypothetical protein IJI28_01055 [Candidatus Saccharibacteria bacterium]|nr:hypothetical protein [Candidatus Saccharibacteria bacterium]